jgi:hypothetical protein
MKASRGKGAGGIMMKGLEALLRGEWATDEPEVGRLMNGKVASELNCHAQGTGRSCRNRSLLIVALTVPVIPFYRGLGWVEEGDIFEYV